MHTYSHFSLPQFSSEFPNCLVCMFWIFCIFVFFFLTFSNRSDIRILCILIRGTQICPISMFINPCQTSFCCAMISCYRSGGERVQHCLICDRNERLRFGTTVKINISLMLPEIGQIKHWFRLFISIMLFGWILDLNLCRCFRNVALGFRYSPHFYVSHHTHEWCHEFFIFILIFDYPISYIQATKIYYKP